MARKKYELNIKIWNECETIENENEKQKMETKEEKKIRIREEPKVNKKCFILINIWFAKKTCFIILLHECPKRTQLRVEIIFILVSVKLFQKL